MTEIQIEPWERVAILLVTFAIACCGIATLLYGLGFLLNALDHVP